MENSSNRYIGSVKWFNNRNGFGFITASEGPHTGKDIFVHHKAIKVAMNQYTYLCQGEYVEFDLSSANNDKHDVQATNVTGVRGGKLMCETQHENPKRGRPHFRQHNQSNDGYVQVQGRRSTGHRYNNYRSNKPNSKNNSNNNTNTSA